MSFTISGANAASKSVISQNEGFPFSTYRQFASVLLAARSAPRHKTILGVRITAAATTAAGQIAVSSHLSSAWPPREGSAVIVSRIRNTCLHRDRIRRSGFKGAIHTKGRAWPTSFGSLAIFTAIRRASSLVSSLAADRRPGSFSK